MGAVSQRDLMLHQQQQAALQQQQQAKDDAAKIALQQAQAGYYNARPEIAAATEAGKNTRAAARISDKDLALEAKMQKDGYVRVPDDYAGSVTTINGNRYRAPTTEETNKAAADKAGLVKTAQTAAQVEAAKQLPSAAIAKRFGLDPNVKLSPFENKAYVEKMLKPPKIKMEADANNNLQVITVDPDSGKTIAMQPVPGFKARPQVFNEQLNSAEAAKEATFLGERMQRITAASTVRDKQLADITSGLSDAKPDDIQAAYAAKVAAHDQTYAAQVGLMRAARKGANPAATPVPNSAQALAEQYKQKHQLP
jgi:hypothetical protein